MDLIEVFQQVSPITLLIAAMAVIFLFKTGVEFVGWCKRTFIKPAVEENNQQLCLEARIKNCENDIKKLFKKQEDQDRDIERLSEKIAELAEINKQAQKNIIKITKILEEQGENIKKLNDDVALLLDSDKAAIKAWITRYHHKLMEMGWVDDYSLDTIEGRYQHYLSEHGNSFVGDLMEEIRALPHTPPSAAEHK